jgi:D-alanyl-D-alanine carboxypeptidase/D-alanyl-D-alanine-endopeptidase (penicillin-binding protein 4)
MDLEKAVEQLVEGTNLGGAHVAVAAMDLDQGQWLVQMNSDEPMIPASNMKLITTAAALDVLGPQFVFQTRLGMIEAGLGQKASLVIEGDGDPAFGDPVLLKQHGLNVEKLLAEWTAAVVGTGVKEFEELIINDRVFDRQFVHPTWPTADLTKHYGAQVAGLNFYENCVDILPVPTKPGQSPRIELFPPAPFVETINRAVTGKTDYFTMDRRLGSNELIFGGSVRNRRTEPFQITIDNPPLFFGRLFANQLKAQGVTVGLVRCVGEQDQLPAVRPLHVVQSTLPVVVGRTNQDSQNMFAEALCKRMGRQITGAPGSWENGAAAIRMSLQQRLGPSGAAVAIADGSGLSRDNRVTARLLVELLGSIRSDAARWEIYRDSLTFRGRDESGDVEGAGSLDRQKRFRGLNAGSWVYGKTGYINGVCCLSGYLIIASPDSDQRRTIAFSLLFNGYKPPVQTYQIKALQDRVVEMLEDAFVESAYGG